MSKRWPTAPLGDLVDVFDSKRVPITKKDRKPGPIPYYGATGILDWVEGYIFDEPLVLIGEDGAKWESGEGTAFQIDGKSWVNNHAHAIRPNRDLLLDDWLVYILVGMDLTPWTSGLTVPKLNQGNLRQIPIPLPPLDEQRRIVATLDEALGEIGELKRNRQAKIEAFEDVKASMLTELLQPNPGTAVSEGWPTERLGELCSLQNGYAFKSKEYSESGAFLMRIGNVQDGFLTHDKPAFVSLDQDGLERFALNVGDMLVSLTGNIGRVGEVRPEHLPAALNQRVCRITVRATSLEHGFLFYFLRSKQFRDYLGRAGHGAAQQNVSTSEIAEVQIPLPPLDEQRRIVATLDEAALAADSGKVAATEELELADAIASSLMTELLTAA